MKYIIFFLIVILSHCQKEPLKIQKSELCEYFDSKGICKDILSTKNTYEIEIPKSKKMDSWDTLSNHLYFHSRKTPGFIIRFNRKPTSEERKQILDSYKAYYLFKDNTGKVEGFEFGEDWIGGFQYLGSMLKDRQRDRKEEKAYPFLYTIFPARVKFSFSSDLFSGEMETEVDLKLNYSTQ